MKPSGFGAIAAPPKPKLCPYGAVATSTVRRPVMTPPPVKVRFRRALASRSLLKTEQPRNVELYRHLGFALVEHFTVPSSGLDAWAFRREL